MVSIQLIKQKLDIIGNDFKLNRSIEKALQVASTDISVLVMGESGVGKENIPKIIHLQSHRKHNKLIAVNCGAIPEGTIDSELFGHEKGSFTGATSTRSGYFEEADGGTIFLDEVGELPLTTQVRLLRVLENGEFIKVGSSKVQKTNVRIVAATNIKMDDAIKNGKFREDLYYRLSTVEIHLPPLRDRRDDIHLLFRKFSSDFARKYKMPSIRVDEGALEVLKNYRWSGNIRQLRNVAEQLSVLEKERLINEETLREYLPNFKHSYLPTVKKNKEPPSSSNENERELLYKVLFDMKNDLNDLKKLTLDLIKKGDFQKVKGENENLIHRIYGNSVSDKNHHENQEDIKLIEASNEDTNIENPPYSASPEKNYNEKIKDSLSLQENEFNLITIALKRSKGKRKNAAKELGISERTLYRKLKQYDLA